MLSVQVRGWGETGAFDGGSDGDTDGEGGLSLHGSTKNHSIPDQTLSEQRACATSRTLTSLPCFDI